MQKKITKLRHYYIGDFFSLDFLADIVVAILNGKCDRYYSSEWFLAFLANFLWLIFFLTGIFFELGIKIQPKIKNSTQNLPLYYRPYFRSKIWFFLAKITCSHAPFFRKKRLLEQCKKSKEQKKTTHYNIELEMKYFVLYFWSKKEKIKSKIPCSHGQNLWENELHESCVFLKLVLCQNHATLMVKLHKKTPWIKG